MYGIFPSFSPLHLEFNPGSRIIDNFSDYFSFNSANKKEKDNICSQQLDEMVLQFSSSPSMAIVVTDASIKNNIATSISHVHLVNQSLTKTVHYTAFVTSTEAELFTIRCSINQASNKENISRVVIVTDFIHVAKKIFDSKLYPY